MTIDEAQAAVTAAKENYKSAVRDYRDAIKPTDTEFAKAKVRVEVFNDEERFR